MDPNVKTPYPEAQHLQPQAMEAPPPYSTPGSPAVIPVASPMPQPQQYAYPPQMGPPSPVVTMAAPPGVASPVVVAQPVVNTVVVSSGTTILGNAPADVTCPTCHVHVKTNVRKSLKAEAWICCLLLCLFGCELCIWIPFVMDSNYKVEHSCPNCRSYIGSTLWLLLIARITDFLFHTLSNLTM